jgi:hypothetical protein
MLEMALISSLMLIGLLISSLTALLQDFISITAEIIPIHPLHTQFNTPDLVINATVVSLQ